MGKRNSFAVTPAGRERAARVLGLDELPSKLNWPQVITRRLTRNADQLLAEWSAKTPADRQQAWDAAPPHSDDDILRALALLPPDAPPAAVTAELDPC